MPFYSLLFTRAPVVALISIIMSERAHPFNTTSFAPPYMLPGVKIKKKMYKKSMNLTYKKYKEYCTRICQRRRWCVFCFSETAFRERATSIIRSALCRVVQAQSEDGSKDTSRRRVQCSLDVCISMCVYIWKSVAASAFQFLLICRYLAAIFFLYMIFSSTHTPPNKRECNRNGA